MNMHKSGGYRSILHYRQGDKAFFVYGWPKNERGNIEEDEVGAFKKQARLMFALDDGRLRKLIENETYQPDCESNPLPSPQSHDYAAGRVDCRVA